MHNPRKKVERVRHGVSAFFRYGMEMMFFLLVVIQLEALYASVGEALSLWEYAAWGVLLFVLTALPFYTLPERYQKHSLWVTVPVLALLGGALWQMDIVLLLAMIIVPVWRSLRALHVQEIHNELVDRFLVFVAGIIGAYFFTLLADTEAMMAYLPSFLIIQFMLFMGGLLWFHFVRSAKGTSLTLWTWLKGQTFLIYIGAGVLLFVLGGFILLPVLQYVVFVLPQMIMQWITADRLLPFYEWLEQLMPELPGSGQGQDQEGGPQNHTGDLLDEMEEEEGLIPAWVNQVLFRSLQGVILIALLYACYRFLRRFYTRPSTSSPDTEGNTYSLQQSGGEKKQRSWFRKMNWAEDEVRRKYQRLRLRAKRKNQHLYHFAHTAREWTRPYEKDANTRELWHNINQVYEQRRYGTKELSKEELNQFHQWVKEAKHSIDTEAKKRNEGQ